MNLPMSRSDAFAGLHSQAPLSAQRALQQGMRQLVQAHLAAGPNGDAAVGSADTAAVLLQRIRRLQRFVDAQDIGQDVALEEAARAALPRPPTTSPALDPLAELLLWQFHLELAELVAAEPQLSIPATLLRPLLQRQLQTLERFCACSLWTLAFFISSGLARQWRHTHVLALFCASESISTALQRLEAKCLRLHLNGDMPGADGRAELLRELAILKEAPFVKPGDPRADESRQSSASKVACAEELHRYGQQLRTLLPTAEVEFEPAEQLLTALYKLTWVSAACDGEPRAVAWCCAYQLCCQHWFQHRALPAAISGVLKQLLSTTTIGQAAEFNSEAIWLCLTQLFDQWPNDTSEASLPIALNADTAKSPHIVSLQAIPLLLSDSFTLLVQVSPAWFSVHAGDSVALAALLQELALLEKGAAAVKVWPLEQLCTLLLELYAQAQRAGLALPVELLADAHADLIRLLDQAAAWREIDTNGAIISALQQWIDSAAESRPGFSIASPTPAELASSQLYQALLVYVRTLALVVEKPVRLHIDPDNEVLPAVLVSQIAEALKPLLRFVLLDNASAVYSRRAAHKPLIHTVSIHLRREGPKLWVMLSEDNEGPLLTPAQTRQLQRALPPAAGPLGCELHHGQGRWFSFTFKEDPPDQKIAR